MFFSPLIFFYFYLFLRRQEKLFILLKQEQVFFGDACLASVNHPSKAQTGRLRLVT